MKTWKKAISLISFAILAGGGIASVPLIVTSCAKNSKAASIAILNKNDLASQYTGYFHTFSATPTLICVNNNETPVNATYTVAPELPAGLSINKTTGSISGIPASFSTTKSYTITATYEGFTDTVSTNISVVDALSIDSLVSTEYLVTGNIYASRDNVITVGHNLLNLAAYAAAKGYDGNDFIIDGTVNFGIMIGFDQNINLSGTSNALLNCVATAHDAVGIVVGSTDNPTLGQDIYQGNMNIYPSVAVNVVSSDITSLVNVYGVLCSSTSPGSTQSVNGTFTLSAVSTNSSVYGVGFDIADGSITIGGIFNIFSAGAAAMGAYFSHTVDGSTQTIDGVFVITDSNNANDGRLDSLSFSESAGMAYGVFSNDTAGGSTQIISGTFSISSFNIAAGVMFQDAAGAVTVNGAFTISAVTVFGVGIQRHAGSAEITGVFTVYGSSDVGGVSLGNPVTGTISGLPTFFSNKTDGGDWITNGKTENWNGVLCSTATTQADINLSLQSIYNTPSVASHNYYIMVIEAATWNSKIDFNYAYRQSLSTYVGTLPNSSVGKIWLDAILLQTW